MVILFGAFLTLLTFTAAQDVALLGKPPVKSNYVCPSRFIRLKHKCYYFSDKVATWQDAYWECRSLKSNLAIIRNANQDKFIKRTLSKKSEKPVERWIGGVYDWEQMAWKWAASGKRVTYQGFSRIENDEEKLRWHCITVDPALQYKWNSKSCLEEKHFICHTKIRNPKKRGKKKLQQLYDTNKYSILNEIPTPDLPNTYSNFTTLKLNQPNGLSFDISNDINSEFASRPAEKKKRKVKHRKRVQHVYQNGTVIYEIPSKVIENRKRRYKYKKEKEGVAFADPNHIRWRTYYQEEMKNPLYPRKIVEEYTILSSNELGDNTVKE